MRPMWTCSECGHRHTGPGLANICVGCPCEYRPTDHGLDAEQVEHLRHVLRACRAVTPPGTGDYTEGYHEGAITAYDLALRQIEQLLAEPTPSAQGDTAAAGV